MHLLTIVLGTDHHGSLRSVPTSTYCRSFREILQGRHIEVDVCLSVSLASAGPPNRTPCRDLTGDALALRFGSAAEGLSLREALQRSSERHRAQLGGAPAELIVWLAARHLLVSWAGNGQIRYAVSFTCPVDSSPSYPSRLSKESWSHLVRAALSCSALRRSRRRQRGPPRRSGGSCCLWARRGPPRGRCTFPGQASGTPSRIWPRLPI